MKFVIDTHNPGKVVEFKRLLEPMGIQAVMVEDLSEPDETGTTFAENAYIKAAAACRETGLPAVADDSGLCVDYLDGAPGIYSARFMGEDTSYDVKNTALVEKLSGVPDEKRTARFACAIACALPDGRILTSYGTMEGRIGYEIKGENGFGYDPIFFLPEYGCTSAEISAEKKNELSHRGKALRSMKVKLEKLLREG